VFNLQQALHNVAHAIVPLSVTSILCNVVHMLALYKAAWYLDIMEDVIGYV